MEEEDAYVMAHLPPPTVKKRTLEEIAERKNEQKKARIKQAFALKNIKADVKETPVIFCIGSKNTQDIPVTGPGPWKVFMLINVNANEATKKQVEIRLHTNPDLVTNIKNEMNQGAWVVVATLGDFCVYEDALQVFSEWSENTRGPIPRLAKAIVIAERYRANGIQLSLTQHTKEEVRAILAARKTEETLHGAITVKEALTGPVKQTTARRSNKGPGTGRRKK